MSRKPTIIHRDRR
jgi:hypothetical protein